MNWQNDFFCLFCLVLYGMGWSQVYVSYTRAEERGARGTRALLLNLFRGGRAPQLSAHINLPIEGILAKYFARNTLMYLNYNLLGNRCSSTKMLIGNKEKSVSYSKTGLVSNLDGGISLNDLKLLILSHLFSTFPLVPLCIM